MEKGQTWSMEKNGEGSDLVFGFHDVMPRGLTLAKPSWRHDMPRKPRPLQAQVKF